jgi:hypothetical protein
MCLVPRALMAARISSICPDGPFYFRLAQSLERGDLAGAFEEMNLNVYPVLLAGLHALGLDWEIGGKLWGVAASSLAVLPLFGLFRRQFGDRVGVTAAVLYAAHPKLIEWSPEIYREPSFWLFFSTALYFLWRGAAEARLRWWLGGGAAVTLAALTRVEGLFLYIPLALWPVAHFPAASRQRLLVSVGAAAAALCLPAAVTAVNLTLLSDRQEWQSVRMMPLHLASNWSNRLLSRLVPSKADPPPIVAPAPSPSPAVPGPPSAVPPPAVRARAPISTGRQVYWFLLTLNRGISPVYLVLLMIGLHRWPFPFRRLDQLSLLLVCAAVMLGIWIHLGASGESSSRYVMSILLIALPYTALGLHWASERAAQMAGRRLEAWPARTRTPLALAASVLVIMLVAGTADALVRNDAIRDTRAAFGRWIKHSFGPHSHVVGTRDMESLITYYSEGDFHTLPARPTPSDALQVIREAHPDVVLLPVQQSPDEWQTLIDELPVELALEPAQPDRIPERPGRYLVLLKNGSERR